MSDKLSSGIILSICDIIAMSDNSISLLCNNHANISQFAALIIFFIIPHACI